MVALQGLFYRLLYRLLTRGRMRSGAGSLLLRPSLLQIERGGLLILEPGAVIDRGARIVVRESVLRVGRGAYVGAGVTLVAYADVTIGARVLIGERVSVHSEDHGPVGRRDMFCVSPVVIGEDAWICAGSVLSKGADIGARTTIGANSFVRGEVPSDVLAAGSPARVIRPLDRSA